MALSTQDFDYIREFVYKQAAIVIEPGKEYLVEARMQTLARREGLESLAMIVELLRRQPTKELERKIVDAMTTNETSFFRDLSPFEGMRKVIIPELMQRRQATKEIRIWCAASSTGQEPYTIAMLLLEHFPQLKDWHVSMLATDICTEVLERARAGIYTQFEVNRGLPVNYLVKYFTKHENEFHLKDDVKKIVEYRQMNLAEKFPAMRPFDLVFIRNVLIYFDRDTKKQILEQVRSVMKEDGILFLGTAETTMMLDDNLVSVDLGGARCYKKGGL